MKNKKRRDYIKNRIKDFLVDSSKYSRIRISDDEIGPSIQEIDNIWKKDQQNSQNPEEEGDQS